MKPLPTPRDLILALDMAAVTAEVVTRLREDPSPGSALALEFACDWAEAEDPDSFDPRLPEHADEFGDFLRGKAREGVARAAHVLAHGILRRPDGRIELWREIVVDPLWDRGEVYSRPLGTCWAFEPGAAEAHWGEGGPGRIRIVVHGAVDPAGADWAETVALNAVSGDTLGEEECEVRLRPEARVEILGLYERGAFGRDVQARPADGLVGAVIAAGEGDPAELDCGHHDALHEEARARTGHFGESGAGCVVLARSTGRMLLPLRSDEVDEPGTYGTWGGAVDPGLDPRVAALRELRQEAGFSQPFEMVPLLVYRRPGSSFVYRNYLVLVDDEFDPVLNHETESAGWFGLDETPAPLHFGFAAVLADPGSLRVIQGYAEGAEAAPSMAA